MSKQERGCIFFNFGRKCIIFLHVSLYSLRKVYNGPVTVMLDKTEDQKKLCTELERYNVAIQWFEKGKLNHSSLRAHILEKTPYKTTLILDSDLLFLHPIDELWEYIEQEGILLTRFFGNPYGLNGTSRSYLKSWGSRLRDLEKTKPVLSDQEFANAKKMLLEDGVDLNVGVMGFCEDKGKEFIQSYTDRMNQAIQNNLIDFVIDEVLAVALCHKYPHYLLNEEWNCPADRYFRRAKVEDAKILHFLADGCCTDAGILGRRPRTKAGRIWFAYFQALTQEVDLSHWYQDDRILIANWYHQEHRFRKYFKTFFEYRLSSMRRIYSRRYRRRFIRSDFVPPV